MRSLTQRVNSYLAMFLIAIIGSGAAMLIVHIADTSANTFFM
jgi:hypothetical protein